MTALDAFELAGSHDRDLGKRAQAGDAAARRALIERYVPLARSLALRYSRSGEPLEDLVQVASVALIKAVDRWEPALGHAFSSYAVPTILGELRRYFRDSTWMVRPPRGLLELSLVIERLREPLAAALGHEPTIAELADHLDRPASEVAQAQEAFASRAARSLDTPVAEGEHDTTIVDLLGQDDDGYEQAEARTVIDGLMPILDQRARTILHMRYEHDLLQADIAMAVGLSQMHVSRVISSSLERLSTYAAGLELHLQAA
jgi:RNA polymerase sigma-B factor